MTKEPENSGQKHVSRDKGGRWRKGASGNVRGKPKGARNKASQLAEVLFDGAAEKLSEKAIEMALEGDGTALKLCLDRILPVRKDRPVTIPLPMMESVADLSKITSALVTATATGRLSPAEASELAKIVEIHRTAIEVVDFETRLRVLENASHDRSENGQ